MSRVPVSNSKTFEAVLWTRSLQSVIHPTEDDEPALQSIPVAMGRPRDPRRLGESGAPEGASKREAGTLAECADTAWSVLLGQPCVCC